MKFRTIIVCCLALVALAFYLGAVAGAFAVTQADPPNNPPPAGDQLDEGPTPVRAPSTDLAPARYIF